jgi:anti-sigma B factor antagonist
MDVGWSASTIGGHDVVALNGDLDVHTASALRENLIERVTTASGPVIVDLGAVDFLDSSGLGALVAAHAPDSSLVVVCPQPRLRKLFAITSLDTAIPVVDSIDEALAVIDGGRPGGQ